MQIILKVTDEEKRVLDSWLGVDEIVGWIEHALENKIRQRIDASVLEVTDFNPKKLTKTEKLLLLRDIVLPTREERNESEPEIAIPRGPK